MSNIVQIHAYDITPIQDICGEIRELYKSSRLSIAHAIMHDASGEHYHKSTEESYYVTRGKGTLFINDEPHEIREGDLIVIPAGRRHYTVPKELIEVLVVCSPPWSPNDVYTKKL